MERFQVPGRGEVSANNQEIFDNLQNALGFVPNLYATMAYSDTALENYLQFQNAKTSFSKREKEVVNLVVSEVNNCKYCVAAHTTIGKMNSFSDEQILELRSGFASWDNKLDALVKLAKEITETRGQVDPSFTEAFFEAGYTKGNLVDVVLLVADKVVMNYVFGLTNIPIDFPAARELEKVEG